MPAAIKATITDALIFRHDAGEDQDACDRALNWLSQHAAPVAAQTADDARDAERYRWLRARWGRIADEYDGDSDQLVAIREADSHFEGWDVDPESLDAAIDAAMKEQGHA